MTPTADLPDCDDPPPLLPPAPRNVRETGLDAALLAGLVAKSMLSGKCALTALAARLRLPVSVLREVLDGLLAEQLAEVAWRGDSDLDLDCQLSGAGRQFAEAWLARQPYVGPAPVAFEAWRRALQAQASHLSPVRLPDMAAVFGDDCQPPRVHELAGTAMHAGRALCLYGPAGSGKSTLARKLGRLLQGVVALPHAVALGQAIMLLHDPAVHRAPGTLAGRGAGDARWLLCQRPVLRLGAELEAHTLELRHDAASGCFLAPPQLKACHGLLIIDDLGRQRLPAGQVINRLSQLLDTGTEPLFLPGNYPVTVPCRPMLVFATHLAPGALLDAAALRRIGYKVGLGALPEASYRALLRQQGRARGMAVADAALDYLVHTLHGGGQPMLACLPRELMARVADFAGFAGRAPEASVAALGQAWSSLFAGDAPVLSEQVA